MLTDADDYKWCRPNADGECVAGSLAANPYIYFSLSTLDPSTHYCTGGENPVPTYDICFGNFVTLGLSQNQTKFVNGDTTGGVTTRPLSRMWQKYFVGSLGNTIKLTHDGQWALFWMCPGDNCNAASEVWSMKVPPDPGPDGVSRDQFVPAILSLSPPSGHGITKAQVKFWYDEQSGTSSDPYCNSRREGCVAVTASINPANPYYYAATDTYSALACATTCTIEIPVLPLHAAYFTVEYLNVGGSVVSTESGVALESVVTKITSTGGGSIYQGKFHGTIQ